MKTADLATMLRHGCSRVLNTFPRHNRVPEPIPNLWFTCQEHRPTFSNWKKYKDIFSYLYRDPNTLTKLGGDSKKTYLAYFSSLFQKIKLFSPLFSLVLKTIPKTYFSIAGATNGIESAIWLFDSMLEKNIVTWTSLFSGLLKIGSMELGCSIFEQMQEINEFSWNSMISEYIRIGDVNTTEFIFNQLAEKTIVSWTTMIFRLHHDWRFWISKKILWSNAG